MSFLREDSKVKLEVLKIMSKYTNDVEDLEIYSKSFMLWIMGDERRIFTPVEN